MGIIHTNETSNGSVDAVFHVPVPTGYNDAGVPWSECVRCSKDYPKDTIAFQKNDLPAIKAGEIIEIRERFQFSAPDLNDAEKLVELKARFDALTIETHDEITTKYRVWGFEKDS